MPSDYKPQPLVGFRSNKAAQIAAFFAVQSGRAIAKLKLIKLIYLAEREHLRRYGRPMLYDELFSLPHGPICSSALNGIDGRLDKTAWGKFVVRNDSSVSAIKDFKRESFDQISDAEFDVLRAIWEEFGKLTASQIRNYTHKNCLEYTDVAKGRVPISYKAVLTAVGREDADDAADWIDAQRRVEALFAV